jgi:hypothetical protein
MIWTLLPFGIVALLVAAIPLAEAFGVSLMHLLCREVPPAGRQSSKSGRWAAPLFSEVIIYRGVPLKERS